MISPYDMNMISMMMSFSCTTLISYDTGINMIPIGTSVGNPVGAVTANEV